MTTLFVSIGTAVAAVPPTGPSFCGTCRGLVYITPIRAKAVSVITLFVSTAVAAVPPSGRPCVRAQHATGKVPPWCREKHVVDYKYVYTNHLLFFVWVNVCRLYFEVIVFAFFSRAFGVKRIV